LTYRDQINKIYSKIDSFASLGLEAIFDYQIYIDDLINSGFYQILSDVLVTKYDINIRSYTYTEDFKTDSFKKILNKTIPKYSRDIYSLKISKNVYSVGYHFYEGSYSNYLGDIVEIEAFDKNTILKDKALWTLQDQISAISLEVISGLSSSIKDAISQFPVDLGQKIHYNLNSEFFYQGLLYKCTNPYTWNKDIGTLYTPTYSSHWTQIYPLTYSQTIISDNTLPLINKYSKAIDILKSLNNIS